MYRNNHVFMPNNTYIGINFDFIKDNIASTFKDYEDYGSIIVVRNQEIMMSVTNTGKIQLFYDIIDNSVIERHITAVESLFKDQVCGFSLLN